MYLIISFVIILSCLYRIEIIRFGYDKSILPARHKKCCTRSLPIPRLTSFVIYFFETLGYLLRPAVIESLVRINDSLDFVGLTIPSDLYGYCSYNTIQVCCCVVLLITSSFSFHMMQSDINQSL